jgi:signal peptide peptidase SppA
MKTYSRVARAVLSRPWAIQRDSVQWAAIVEVLGHRLAGNPFTEEEIEERLAARRRPENMAAVRVAQRATEREGRYVAILPVHGVLMPRVDMMSELSGGTSVAQLSAAFGELVADESVEAIVLDVDSPGGLVDGIPEFAAQIREARDRKTIVAVADTMAASAAYWVASQATEVSVTPSGEVGSIGVFSAHEDASKFYEDLGVKTTLIRAGKYKAEANEFEPLSEEAQAHIQSIVDDYYGMFVSAVAKGRGIKASDVRNGYGEGRVLTASMAKAEGMVDRIETLGEAVDRVSRAAGGRKRSRSAVERAGGVLVQGSGEEHFVSDEQVHQVAELHDVPVQLISPTNADEADAEETVTEAIDAAEDEAPRAVAFEVEQAIYRSRSRRLRRTS